MRFNRLQIRLGFLFGVCLMVTVFVMTGYRILSDRKKESRMLEESVQRSREFATKRLFQIGGTAALRIQSEFERAFDVARTLADTLSGVKDKRIGLKIDRDRVNGILRSILVRNAGFLGVYTAWETDAFDAMDVIYAGTKWHEESGRFMPGWSRGEDGKIEFAVITDLENTEKYENGVRKGDFYLLPRATQKESIVDPYPISSQTKTDYKTSLVVPIVMDNVFYGIAGVDLRLDFIKRVLTEGNQQIYEGKGKIGVVSYNGILAGTSGKLELTGKPVKDWLGDNWQEDLKRLREAKEETITEDGFLKVSVPLNIGGTDTPWALMIMVPENIVTARAAARVAELRTTARRELMSEIGIGIGVMAVVMILVWMFAGRIAVPIAQVITGLKTDSVRLTTASDQLASASRDSAERASEQVAVLEETTATLEEMAAMTQNNADNADQVNQLVKETNRIVAKANQVMSELTQSIEEASAASLETSKILKTIDDIAFQTNLLALNAAVEAARAGEAGAGFAVVADEVRNLALHSAEAAKNTAALIEGIVKKVGYGAELVVRTNDTFSEVTRSSEKVEVFIEEIASASAEQSKGIRQIAQSIAEMDKAVQQNASDATESTRSSDEMLSMSEAMEGFINNLVSLTGET